VSVPIAQNVEMQTSVHGLHNVVHDDIEGQTTAETHEKKFPKRSVGFGLHDLFLRLERNAGLADQFRIANVRGFGRAELLPRPRDLGGIAVANDFHVRAEGQALEVDHLAEGDIARRDRLTVARAPTETLDRIEGDTMATCHRTFFDRDDTRNSTFKSKTKHDNSFRRNGVYLAFKIEGLLWFGKLLTTKACAGFVE